MSESIPYQPFAAFVMRSPLFPLEFLSQVCGPKPWNEETARLICDQAEIREAIFLASPDLFAEMQRWLDGKLGDEKSLQRFFFSLQRYAVRLCMRCTPFGLFAGFTNGQWGDATDIHLRDRAAYQRHTRLDMHYLCALALSLAKDPKIAPQLHYFPNSSLHRVAGQYRYVEYHYRDKRRIHHIVAVDHTDYLQGVLERAASGVTLDEMADLLLGEEVSREEAQEYVQSLLDNQVLVHTLEPALTGPEFIDQVLAVIEPMAVEPAVGTLRGVRDRLLAIDRAPLGSTTEHYLPLAKEIEVLGTPYELKFLFQTDMVKPATSCRVDSSLVDDILAGLAVCNRLTLPPKETNMSRFRDAFVERYEQREVPLLEVLDTEMGLGYQQAGDGQGDVAPLIDDLRVPGVVDKRATQSLNWSAVDSFLFKKYRQALAEQAMEVTISDEEIGDFFLLWDDLPDTLSAMTHLVWENGSNAPPTVISSGAGGHAGNLLGRFCHADEATHELVRQIMAKEAELNPKVIYAEIVHLPEARMGNILLRPVLREYEIPYLGRSAVAPEKQIHLDDLLVSVRQNRVVLRSRHLDREIRPRLSSAHNFSNNALPIYQFLCDLQSQGIRQGVFFSWGALAGEMPFSPRVRYKNVILSQASWQFVAKEIESLVKKEAHDEELRAEIQGWREKHRLPAAVCLADGDNELYIHFENLLAVRNLLAQVKKRPYFRLVEFPFRHDNTPVLSEQGSFANEFVFCFHKTALKGDAPDA